MTYKIFVLFMLIFLSGCACDFVGVEHVEVTLTPFERMQNEQKVASFQEKILKNSQNTIAITKSEEKSLEELKELHFEFNRSSLGKSQEKILIRNAKILAKNDQLKIILKIHSDNIGKAIYNNRLSQKRAMKIYKILKKRGINSDRLKIEVVPQLADSKINLKKIKNYREIAQIKESSMKDRKLEFIIRGNENPSDVLAVSKVETKLPESKIAESKIPEEKTIKDKNVQKISNLDLGGQSDDSTAGNLKTVFFEYKHKNIIEDQLAILQQNANELKANPNLKILISAHTDGVGGIEYNKKLGLERAKYIANTLIEFGVHKSQLEIETKGPDGKLEEDHSENVKSFQDKQAFKNKFNKNRRVNFIVLKNSENLPASTVLKVAENKNTISEDYKLEINGQSDLKTAGKLNTVYFEYKKKFISPDQLEILKKNAQELIANPKVKIIISAHTDGVGGYRYNQKLGMERAHYIESELLKLGVSQERMTIESKGPSENIEADESSKISTYSQKVEYMAKTNRNRRVNFIIKSIDTEEKVKVSAVSVEQKMTPIPAEPISKPPSRSIEELNNIYYLLTNKKLSPSRANRFDEVLGEVNKLFAKDGVNKKRVLKELMSSFLSDEGRHRLVRYKNISKVKINRFMKLLNGDTNRSIANENKPQIEAKEVVKRVDEVKVESEQNSDLENAEGLKTIYFDYKKKEISKVEMNVLLENIAILKSKPSLKILIVSHTDGVGGDAYNKKLGLKRASYIKNILVANGITSSRLSINTVGSLQPVENDSSEKVITYQDKLQFKSLKNKNRRVNFIIQK